MTSAICEDYNERLFSKTWRSRIHLSRFYWLRSEMRRLGLKNTRIIELGCFDGKTINYIDSAPQEYLGLDANWEGGLDAGRAIWGSFPNVEMRLCKMPEDIPMPDQPYDVGVCMETLEHVPPHLVEPYLCKLSQVMNGYLFITVPVERGLAFLAKHGAKRILGMKDDPFYKGEFCNSIRGRLDRVQRREHKGFDDRALVRQVGEFFDLVSVSGIFPKLPLLSLNLTIGIIAKTRRTRITIDGSA